MAECFETVVLPVVERFARKVFKDEGKQAVAVSVAWYHWSKREQDFPPSVWARWAIYHTLAGRDLPGCGTSNRDIFARLVCWNGAGMQYVTDRQPGPAVVAEKREEVRLLFASLTGKEAILVRELAIGTPANEVARMLDRTPARITQMRQELKARIEG